jgi:hypothetical protein
MQLTINLSFTVEDTVNPDEFLEDILTARPDIINIYQLTPKQAEISDISSNAIIFVPEHDPIA